jgi:agmatinase
VIPVLSPLFLSARAGREGAEIVLLGVPFDGTSSFRPGSRFGPSAIRAWSPLLETWSPLFGRDLAEVALADLGDLDLPVAGWERVEPVVRAATGEILAAGQVPVLLGGEHLVTLAAVAAAQERHPDLCVLQFDAHLDLRAEYLGDPFSHATVMRRIVELAGPERVMQWGARSGERGEWDWARRNRTLVADMAEVRERASGRPIYLTIDLDVLDPSVFPATGAPDPGGATFRELEAALLALRGERIVAADLVEFSPAAGPGAGDASGAAAAKAVRETILLVAEGRRAAQEG